MNKLGALTHSILTLLEFAILGVLFVINREWYSERLLLWKLYCAKKNYACLITEKKVEENECQMKISKLRAEYESVESVLRVSVRNIIKDLEEKAKLKSASKITFTQSQIFNRFTPSEISLKEKATLLTLEIETLERRCSCTQQLALFIYKIIVKISEVENRIKLNNDMSKIQQHGNPFINFNDIINTSHQQFTKNIDGLLNINEAINTMDIDDPESLSLINHELRDKDTALLNKLIPGVISRIDINPPLSLHTE